MDVPVASLTARKALADRVRGQGDRPMTLHTDKDKEYKKVSPFILFLIGITAGAIAAIFPRIMTFLSTGNDNVQISLFSGAFWLATAAFALMVGISMIWLFLGTSDTTKNLFMAALALPAILA